MIASVLGVTLYEALMLVAVLDGGPHDAAPVRVPVSVLSVSVSVVVLSFSVPRLLGACGPLIVMLQMPVTAIVQLKPVSRFAVTDVAVPVAVSVIVPVQETVDCGSPVRHGELNVSCTEMELDAGLRVVPVIVPV